MTVKYLIILIIFTPVFCSAQKEITYEGIRLRLLHASSFNPFYDSIRFNKTRDTAYLYRSAVSIIHETKAGGGATSAYFINSKKEKLYFYRWDYSDTSETAWGKNDIWSDHYPDSAEIVSKYYLSAEKENFRLVIQPETPAHLYDQQETLGGMKPLKPYDLNLSWEEHSTK